MRMRRSWHHIPWLSQVQRITTGTGLIITEDQESRAVLFNSWFGGTKLSSFFSGVKKDHPLGWGELNPQRRVVVLFVWNMEYPKSNFFPSWDFKGTFFTVIRQNCFSITWKSHISDLNQTRFLSTGSCKFKCWSLVPARQRWWPTEAQRITSY